MITPITGQRNRKIICCTFADEVEEYGEVLPFFALGRDPRTDTWFLTRNHDMDVVFPRKPVVDPYDRLFSAELVHGENSDICKAIEKEIDESISESEFEESCNIDTDVIGNTKVNQQYILTIYEVAKTAGYCLGESGVLVHWLFVRAARLLETGKV